MALSESDREELKALIKSTLNSGCLCGRSEEVVQLVGRFETLGDGNAAKGIESFAKTIGMMTKVRKFGEKAGGAAAVTIVLSALSGLGTLIYYGFKAIVVTWRGQ